LRFRQAIELADGNKFVYPAETMHLSSGANPRTPHIHGESVSKALRRLRSQYGIDDITLHDLRRSISTWLGDNGTRPDVIDLILNHQPRDVTRRHYNLSTMQDLVRAALQVWADHVTKRGE
jgi:integrase